MEREEDIHDELNDLAPGFPSKKSMDPPPVYFDLFPDRVLNRWRKEQSQPVLKKVFWWKITGIAAIVTGLCIGGWWFFTVPATIRVNDITAAEAYQYINENISEFETLIETENIRMVENQVDVPKEAIEEYLMEEIQGSDPEDLF